MSKIKVGFPGKYYIAKSKGVTKDDTYSMRIDSAFKILRARKGWDYAKTSSYSGRDGMVRSTDSPRRPGNSNLEQASMDDINYVEDKTKDGHANYYAHVTPSEGKIKIWNAHLDSWVFVHPDLRAKR